MKKGGLGKSSTVFLVSLLMMWAQAGFSATVSNLSPGVQEEGPSVRQAAPSPGAALADRDGDGLSDGLQARLAKASPTDLFDVIVTFSGPGNAAAAQKAVGPFKVKREFRIISGFAATMTAAQARGLARARGVLRIEEDFRIFAVMNAARRDFGVEKARAFASDNSGVDLTGDGVGICVVDTGVDAGHEQLDGGKVAGFIDYVGGRTAPYDDHGHGTHVSSMAAGDGTGGTNAAAYRGVAPGASIYAAKVLNSQGSGSDSDVIAGVEWCAEQPGVDVISMSLGSAGSSDGSDSLSQAVNSAVADGIVAVVAAGNSGDEAGTVGSPGAAEGAITAGAVAEWSAPPGAPNHSEGVYLAPFSSRGPTADGRTKPDITAPGVSITAAEAGTVSGYVTYSGTSMATPFTAGTVALLLQGNPDLSPSDVKRILRSTAQDRGAVGPDNDWGAGLLDVYAAAAKAMGIDVDPPNPFPDWQRISGSVDDNGLWNGTFEVDDTELPIGITLTIDGAPECSLGFLGYCLIWEWSPDLDARLLDPQGNVLAVSTCLNGSECGGIGRQETLHVMPTTTGTYTVQV
ncbi:MAG: S8 family serine peptidase [Desulfuromonadales bacterium]